MVCQGVARLGWAMHGQAGQGGQWPENDAHGQPENIINCLKRHGEAWHGEVRRGWARRVKGAFGPIVQSLMECEMKLIEDHEIQSQLGQLIEVTGHLQRGDILAWETVLQITGQPETDQRTRYVVWKWRRHLQNNRRIETWPENGIGFRLLTDHEQVTLIPRKRAKRAYRQHGKILRAMRNTDMTKLSEADRKIASAVIEHSRQARREALLIRKKIPGEVKTDRAILIERARTAESQRCLCGEESEIAIGRS